MASLAIVDTASLTYLWISLIQQHDTKVLAGTLNVWNYVVMQKRKKGWGGRESNPKILIKDHQTHKLSCKYFEC